MLIMFFIYKEQAFTLPVWGFSTLAVSTDGEEGERRAGGSRAGEELFQGRGNGGSRGVPPVHTGNDQRYCLSIYETLSLPVFKSPLINPF